MKGGGKGGGGKGGGGKGGGWSARGGKGGQSSAGGSAKKRLRAIERLLNKGGLPVDVRAAKEAERAALQGDARKQQRITREKVFSKKYHGVKFVERRKVERRIGQLQRQIAEQQQNAGGSGSATLETELREAEHDLLYVQHYPRSKKYLSLFPSSDADDEYVTKRRRRLRALIVRRVEAGLPVGRPVDDAAGGNDDEVNELFAGASGEARVVDDDFFAASQDEDDGEEEAGRGAEADDDFFAPAPAEAEPDASAKRRNKKAGGDKRLRAEGGDEEPPQEKVRKKKKHRAAD